MNYSKIRNVKSLLRVHNNDAGIDFYVPELEEDFIKDLKNKNSKCKIKNGKIVIRPHERILIPSGIKVNIPEGHALIAFNKSGISSKKGIDLLASVVDESYHGEIHISIYNSGNHKQIIEFGSKIIQFILLPINYSQPNLVDIDELYKNSISERGEGGFGSTDKK